MISIPKRLAGACTMAVLATHGGLSFAATVDTRSDIGFSFTFSDSSSHLDLSKQSNFYSGTTWTANDGIFGPDGTAIPNPASSASVTNAQAGHYAVSNDVSNSSATTTLQSNGGTLSAAVSATSPSTWTESNVVMPFASIAMGGLIVLAPGATANFVGTFNVATSTTNSPSYAAANAYASFGPIVADAIESIYQQFEYADTRPAFGTLAHSGDWATSFTNSGSTDQVIGFVFGVGSDAHLFGAGDGGATGGGTVISPVPEPQTWAMFLGGLAVLGASARRAKARRSESAES